eukprot:gene3316-3801_t
MSQLIIDFNPQCLGPSFDQESVKIALGQLLAQNSSKFISIRMDGERAYVDFDDTENAKRVYQDLNGEEFLGFPINIQFGRSQLNARDDYNGQDEYNDSGDSDERVFEKGSSRARRPYRRNSGRNMPPYQQQQIEQYPCRILIPTKMIKVVLGKGGATIQSIQETTNTKIDVHREKNKGSDDTITTIKGNPKGFSEACQQIIAVISEETEKLSTEEELKPPQLKILSHDSLCGRLIGRSGVNLKRIQDSSGAKVIISNTMFEEFSPFPYSVEPVFSNERVITIEGSVESISVAEKEISKKLRQCMEKDMKTLMSNNVYPQAGLGLLNSMSGLNLYGHPSGSPGYGYHGMGMNPMYSGSPGVNFNGYPNMMNSGGLPYQQMNSYSGPKSTEPEQITISIPTRAVGAIIGKRGSHINNMKMYSQAQVHVIKGEEGGESRVEIGGPPEATWKASLCVFSKIKESLRSSLYDAELKTELYVPGNCLGRIIGKKGSVVLSIQDSSGTEIEVPKDKQGGPKAPIYIKGSFSGTHAALTRIRGISLKAMKDPSKFRRGQKVGLKERELNFVCNASIICSSISCTAPRACRQISYGSTYLPEVLCASENCVQIVNNTRVDKIHAVALHVYQKYSSQQYRLRDGMSCIGHNGSAINATDGSVVLLNASSSGLTVNNTMNMTSNDIICNQMCDLCNNMTCDATNCNMIAGNAVLMQALGSKTYIDCSECQKITCSSNKTCNTVCRKHCNITQCTSDSCNMVCMPNSQCPYLECGKQATNCTVNCLDGAFCNLNCKAADNACQHSCAKSGVCNTQFGGGVVDSHDGQCGNCHCTNAVRNCTQRCEGKEKRCLELHCNASHECHQYSSSTSKSCVYRMKNYSPLATQTCDNGSACWQMLCFGTNCTLTCTGAAKCDYMICKAKTCTFNCQNGAHCDVLTCLPESETCNYNCDTSAKCKIKRCKGKQCVGAAKYVESTADVIKPSYSILLHSLFIIFIHY